MATTVATSASSHVSTSALSSPEAAARPHGLARVRVAIAGIGAAVLGAAPHALHHVGPLTGGDEEAPRTENVPGAQAGVSPAEHVSHHR